MSVPARQRVAIGAGHAHLPPMQQATAPAQCGIGLTLIDPGAI